MEKEFNSTMLNLKELCTYYSKRGYRLPVKYGTELTDIPMDLLIKVIFINCDDASLNEYRDPIRYIKEKLVEDYVIYTSGNEFLVEIAHYKSYLPRIFRFNIWALFVYTYLMKDRELSERNSFLYITILFPYIYKLNKFDRLNKAKIGNILSLYPLKKNGTFNMSDARQWMQKSNNEIEGLLRKEQLFLNKFDRPEDREKYITQVTDNCRAGIEVMWKFFSKGRKR